jgi:hypothetical protein
MFAEFHSYQTLQFRCISIGEIKIFLSVTKAFPSKALPSRVPFVVNLANDQNVMKLSMKNHKVFEVA